MNELNNILNKNKIVPHSNNLAQNIINKAITPEVKPSFFASFKSLILLPKPAYSLAIILTIGFIAGLSSDILPNINEAEILANYEILDDDESLI